MEKCLHWSNKSAMIITTKVSKENSFDAFFAFKGIKEWRKIR